MVVGVAPEILAAATAPARSWKPSVESTAAMSDVLGEGDSDGATAVGAAAAEIITPMKISDTLTAAVAIFSFLICKWKNERNVGFKFN